MNDTCTLSEEAVRRLPESRREGRSDLLQRTVELCNELAHRPNLGLQAAPLYELERCAAIGLMTAPLPLSEGGLGLGVEAGTHQTLLRVLAAVGGADLALGRIYEGHVNGLLLVQRYGTTSQVARLAADVRAGFVSGVWNTGRPELLKLVPEDGGYRFQGEKTFATGAAFVQRPVVTAELPDKGWLMTVPNMETLEHSIDSSFWHPLGMERSESYAVEFTGGFIEESQVIGAPGDFYRDPMFRGGAVRFAAVQAGAVMRLHSLFAEWLDEMRRGEDPYQLARLGAVAIEAQEAAMWVEKAAAVAEESFYRIDKQHLERMIECANMMRVAVERLSTSAMQRVIAGVGAHGLLQPASFERIVRDLTMYLRQPAPDHTVAAIGRYSLEKSHRRSEGSADGFWSDGFRDESLPPKYFERIYRRTRDPWGFESSAYEREKYRATLSSLPQERYGRGLEIGCSIGVLSSLLSERCADFLGVDVSEKALAVARTRCGELPNVTFECMRVPDELPSGEFDLIVISEVAYYWTRSDLERAASELAAHVPPGGHIVLVHLTERVPDYPLTGDEVHEYFLGRREFSHHAGERYERFRIDVLERLPASKAI